jgi:hypothetical protein
VWDEYQFRPVTSRIVDKRGFVTGHDFSRAEELTEKRRALAPAVFFQPFELPQRLKPTHYFELLRHD